MSVFSGRQHKGARRAHRDARYRAAVGRQLMMHDLGHTRAVNPLDGRYCTPAPVDEFLRAGDTPTSADFRSWAKGPR